MLSKIKPYAHFFCGPHNFWKRLHASQMMMMNSTQNFKSQEKDWETAKMKRCDSLVSVYTVFFFKYYYIQLKVNLVLLLKFEIVLISWLLDAMIFCAWVSRRALTYTAWLYAKCAIDSNRALFSHWDGYFLRLAVWLYETFFQLPCRLRIFHWNYFLLMHLANTYFFPGDI